MEKDPLPPRPSSLGAGPGEGAALPDRDRLLGLVVDLAVVHGRVALSSGQEADWYIDMRRLTLHHEGAPLVGRVMRQLTRDLRYDVVGGRAVLVVEDVSTTGSSPLTAVEALREAGAEPVAVAVVVDRGGRAAVEAAGLEYRAAVALAGLGLG